MTWGREQTAYPPICIKSAVFYHEIQSDYFKYVLYEESQIIQFRANIVINYKYVP